MITTEIIQKHRRVQDIARATVNHLRTFIHEGQTEKNIAKEAEDHLKKNGVDGFWYYNIGAFVLVGERTLLSVSGRDYTGPTNATVRAADIVTVDLAPMIDGVWGDFSRTFVIDAGSVVAVDSQKLVEKNVDKELSEGMQAEERLHAKLRQIARPGMTFDEVFHTMNNEIISLGFENIDFHNNLGHTIVSNIAHRTFIESGSNVAVDDAGLFTFEPHIKRKHGGRYGFKREDIYYMEDGMLMVL